MISLADWTERRGARPAMAYSDASDNARSVGVDFVVLIRGTTGMSVDQISRKTCNQFESTSSVREQKQQ